MAYKSRFEEDVANFYKLGDKYEKEKLQYKIESVYIPDFKLAEGVFLEAKGFFKDSDRRKMLAVKDQNPEHTFIMLFQDSKVKLRKKGKMTYADWCDKHGFQWYCWKTKRPTRRVLTLAVKAAAN